MRNMYSLNTISYRKGDNKRSMNQNVPQIGQINKCSSGPRIPESQFFPGLDHIDHNDHIDWLYWLMNYLLWFPPAFDSHLYLNCSFFFREYAKRPTTICCTPTLKFWVSRIREKVKSTSQPPFCAHLYWNFSFFFREFAKIAQFHH